MRNVRTHGSPPFRVALIHGGPGAAGEMAPVAQELAATHGTLEPLQTATSLDGQVEELRTVLEQHAALPVTLLGYSWGAWLSFILAARSPVLVKKLILVSSGPFEERYVRELHATLMARLTADERAQFSAIGSALRDPLTGDSDTLLARLGTLAAKADAYDPLAPAAADADLIGTQAALYQAVWEEAAALRRSGALLALGRQIRCPVVAIHGEHDPHPAAGVRDPLARTLQDFRITLLERCGHTPWRERQAHERFYRIVHAEIASAASA